MSGIILQVRENGSTGAWTTLTLDESGCADVSALTAGMQYDYRLVTEDQTPSPKIYKEGTFTTAGFDPATLFAASEDGAWIEPFDLSSVYQNSDGTGAVTAGDPIGYFTDKSGNANHATQTTSAARMEASAAGAIPDGVDDNFEFPLGANFTGDFCLILSTGPIFGSIDTGADTTWAYTKNPGYIPEGTIYALIVIDRALTSQEKTDLVAHYAGGVTTNPTTASMAFRDRTDLTALDLSYGDWTGVTNAFAAFSDCSSLTTPPDVSGWTGVTNAQSTFRSCSSLTTPPDVSGWTRVSSAPGTFYNCSSLTTPPDVSGWTRVSSAYETFLGCSSLITPPDVSGWTGVRLAIRTFRSCSSFTSAVNLDNWNPTILTDASDMMLGISAAGFDQAAYDSALIAWDAAYDLTTVNTLNIHFGSAQYTTGGAAETARNLLAANGWTITDAGGAA